ncbi:MarP family serine protease [Streptomyces sp. NBC_01795]|uniref:MarP family serine protease n=1 Tax=unclassified Streptomyces TaxID=2593676 RepID=UPI002DDC3252|nr:MULTISPECIES: MarP family serine protease [unclassified Streptomyces]WSA95776.1 MarP family serine protease [Streptomyces sp. NBC_01795]WSB80196.1 MarP family serine protease [Streptomyces sp. NBC_01775]
MNLLDLLLILAALAFAGSGYRRGLVAGLLALAGFVGGAAIGVWLLPFVLDLVERGTTSATVLAMLTVLLPALGGHALASQLAWRLRRAMRWRPVRWADGAGGAVVNVIAVFVVGWMAASVLSASPSPALNQAIRGSAALETVHERMPGGAATWFNRATGALTTAGFPQVFNPFEHEPGGSVPEPSGDSVTRAATAAAQRSTVKVEGVANVEGGQQGQEGSGFVYARGHVMTNAHVVAGVDEPTVRVGGTGRPYAAKVVLFDADKDIAVLNVPGLRAPVLRFAGDAARGDQGVVAGYPENGGLDLRAAAVADRTTARGQDIYGTSLTTRDIYAIRSQVRPGNSGGPLLTPEGRVYGLVFARSTSDAGTGYALTTDQIRAHARQAADATRPVDTGNRSAL